ncbi:hypothetical protein [Tropicimonas aquimaris]|uniref:Cytidylyltransferase family protein n=1 Tax=Tropicimonas aquimaris TaxID=914152 RepID=A0ABW3IS67_9RHOB
MQLLGPLLVAVAAILGLLGFMTLVRRRAEAAGWSAEVQRKLVHVATGLFAICLPFLFAENWPVYMLLGFTVLVMAAMRAPILRGSGASAALHSVDRQSYGDFLLAAAVALVLLLSQRDPLLYVLPLAVLTLGDAAAALAGSTYGRRHFTVEDGVKSVEGSAILFMVTVILSMVCLLLLSEIPRQNVVILGFLIATLGTLVEADSWRGFDNLFLPLAVLIILREHGASPTSELLALAIVFAGAFALFHMLADRLGLSRHVARVYLLAIFLLLSVTAMQNTVLPLAMLVLHVLAERRTPSADRHPELDAVAALAVLSFGWLAAGHATGLNALDFFGATMAGLCIALAALALARAALVLRLGGLALLAAGLWAFWLWLIQANLAAKHWAPNVGLLLLATLALCGLAALRWPGAFHRQRMARLAGLSVALPALTYATFALIGVSS